MAEFLKEAAQLFIILVVVGLYVLFGITSICNALYREKPSGGEA
jgi:hypothetical protein